MSTPDPATSSHTASTPGSGHVLGHDGTPASDSAFRPADLCRGLRFALEASEGRRRRRARDTRPDTIGLRLRRELIDAAVRDDPEPEEFEAWLIQRCVDAGPGNGGVRAMALSILEEWELAKREPSFRSWLSEGAPSEDRFSAEDTRSSKKERE